MTNIELNKADANQNADEILNARLRRLRQRQPIQTEYPASKYTQGKIQRLTDSANTPKTKIKMYGARYTAQAIPNQNNHRAIRAGISCRVCMMWSSGLTKKAEPPPTRGVNRDSGTASANGGWLRRLVRPHGHHLVSARVNQNSKTQPAQIKK